MFSVVSVDSSFASANVAGSMSCWVAVLQQRSRLESKLATVGRLYSDITASVSHCSRNLSISKRKKERNSETGKGRGAVRKMPRKANGPSARDSVASRSQTRPHISMVSGECAILTSRVLSFLPITLYKVFITALSGAVD